LYELYFNPIEIFFSFKQFALLVHTTIAR